VCLLPGTLGPVDYAIKNLREVEDIAARFGFSEVQEARFARKPLESKTIGLAFHIVRPQRRQAFAHRHREAEEIYVVLEGSGRIKLDDDVHEVSTMDAVRAAPHVARAFEAGSEGLELLVFGPHHEGDTEVMQEDFWGEGGG
jgi:mannose-6-phosphate isomerase-like protein (cupin superfamily)